MIRAWCPNCDCEVVPRANGACGFCDADTDMRERAAWPTVVSRASLCASMVASTAGLTLEAAP